MPIEIMSGQENAVPYPHAGISTNERIRHQTIAVRPCQTKASQSMMAASYKRLNLSGC